MSQEWTKSEWHSHDIVVWAVEERCYFCKYPASHKVTEDHIPTEFPIHSLTAYVCCKHFWGFCENTQVHPDIQYDIDHAGEY